MFLVFLSFFVLLLSLFFFLVFAFFFSLLRRSILHAAHGKVEMSNFLDIKSLNVTRSIDPIVPLGPTDIDGFLKNERETALINASEHAQNTVMEDFHDRHFKAMVREWSDRKNEIREILGTGPTMDVRRR